MTYYSHTERELSQIGIQEGEPAIYTGTVNSRQSHTLSPNTDSKNAYVFIWQNGQPRELDACFCHDGADQDVLQFQFDGEKYAFLRDAPSGYIHQISGPVRPVTVANLGAIPLRVDTFLGKFTVHAGAVLRLNESVLQREKQKVLLTVSSRYEQPLKSAERWDGYSWKRLNIREEPFAAGAGRRFAVLDGSAIVQYMNVNENREILMLDSPEPDPDYEIYISTKAADWVTLRFYRTDYRDGQIVQRARRIPYCGWGEPVIYDLQKLRESLTQDAVRQCTACLPGLPDPPVDEDEEIRPAPEKKTRPLISEKLQEFLGVEDGPAKQLLQSDKADMESREEDHGCSGNVSRLGELAETHQDGQKAPAPEPPENFPE